MDPNANASPGDAENLARKKPIAAPNDATGANTGDGAAAHVKAAAQNAGRKEFLASDLSTVRDASKREDPTPVSLPRLQPIVDVTPPTITSPGNGTIVVADPKGAPKLDVTTGVADALPVSSVQWHDVTPPSGPPTGPKPAAADSPVTTIKNPVGDPVVTTIKTAVGEPAVTTIKTAAVAPTLTTSPTATGELTSTGDLTVTTAKTPDALSQDHVTLTSSGPPSLTARNGFSDQVPVIGKIDFHPPADQTTAAGTGPIIPVTLAANQPEVKGAITKAGPPEVKSGSEQTNLLPPSAPGNGTGLKSALSLGTFVDSTGVGNQANPPGSNLSFAPKELLVGNRPSNGTIYQPADAVAFNQALTSGLSQNQGLNPAILQASLTRTADGRSGADLLQQTSIPAYAPFGTAFSAADLTSKSLSDIKFTTSTATSLASATTDVQATPSQFALANTIPLGVTDYGKSSLPIFTNASFRPTSGDGSTSPLIVQTPGTNERALQANASPAVSLTGDAQIIPAAYTAPVIRATPLSLGEIVPAVSHATNLIDATVAVSPSTITADAPTAYLSNASFIPAATVSVQLTNPSRSLIGDKTPELIQASLVSPPGQPESPVLNNLNVISSPLLTQTSESLTLAAAKPKLVPTPEVVTNTASAPLAKSPTPLIGAALANGVDYGANSTPAAVRLGTSANALDLATVATPASPGTLNITTIPLRIADASAGQAPAIPLNTQNLSLGTFTKADGSDPSSKVLVANNDPSLTGDTTLLTSAAIRTTANPGVPTFAAATGIFAQNPDVGPVRSTIKSEDALQYASNSPLLDLQQSSAVGKITALQAVTFAQPIDASTLISQTPAGNLVAESSPLAAIQQRPTVLASGSTSTNYEIPAQQVPLAIKPYGNGTTNIASNTDNSLLRGADVIPTTTLTTLSNPALSLGNILVADTQDKPARILPTASLVTSTSDSTITPPVVPKAIASSDYMLATAATGGTLASAEPSQLRVLAKAPDLQLAAINSPLIEQAALTTAYSPTQAPLYNNNQEVIASIKPVVYSPTNVIGSSDNGLPRTSEVGTTVLASTTSINTTLGLGNGGIVESTGKPVQVVQTASLPASASDNAATTLVGAKVNIGSELTPAVAATSPGSTFASAEANQLRILPKTPEFQLASSNLPVVEQVTAAPPFSPLQVPVFNNTGGEFAMSSSKVNSQLIAANTDLAATPSPPVAPKPPVVLASASPMPSFTVPAESAILSIKPVVYSPTNVVGSSDNVLAKASELSTTSLASNTLINPTLSLGNGGIVEASGRNIPVIQTAALAASASDNAATTSLIAPKVNIAAELTPAVAATSPGSTFASAESNQLRILPKTPDFQLASSNLPVVEQVAASPTFSPLQVPVFNNTGGEFAMSSSKVNSQLMAASTDLAATPSPPVAPHSPVFLASASPIPSFTVPAETQTLSIKPVVYSPTNVAGSSDNVLAKASELSTTSLASSTLINPTLGLGNGGIVESTGKNVQVIQTAALPASASDNAAIPLIAPKVNIAAELTPAVAATSPGSTFASAEANQLRILPKSPEVQIASSNLPVVEQVAAASPFSPLQVPVFNNTGGEFAMSSSKVNSQLIAANTDLAATPSPPVAPKAPVVLASASPMPSFTVPAEPATLSIKPVVYSPINVAGSSDNVLARASDLTTTSLASNTSINPNLGLGNGGIVEATGKPVQVIQIASLPASTGDSATTPLVVPKVNIANELTPAVAATSPGSTFASAESNQLHILSKGADVQIASLNSQTVEQVAATTNKSPLVLASAAAPANYDVNGQAPISIKPYGDATANTLLSQNGGNNSSLARTEGSLNQPIYSQTAALSGQDLTTKANNPTDGQSQATIAATQPTYVASNVDPMRGSALNTARGNGDLRTANSDAENLVAKLGQVSGASNANTLSSQTSGGYARLATAAPGSTAMLGSGDVHALTTTPTALAAIPSAPLISSDGRTIDALHATAGGSLVVLQGSGAIAGPSVIQEVSKGVALANNDKLAVVNIDASLLVGGKSVSEIKGAIPAALEQPLRTIGAPGAVADMSIRPVPGNITLLDLNHTTTALPLGPGGLDPSIKAAVTVVKPPETDISAVKQLLVGQIMTGRLPDGTALSPNPNGIIFAVKGSGVEIDSGSTKLIMLPQRTDLIGQTTTTGVVGATTGISNGGFSEIATVGLINIKGVRTVSDGITDGSHSTTTTNIAGLTGAATSKTAPLVAGAGGPDPLTGTTAAPGTTGVNGQPLPPNSVAGLVAGPLGAGNPDEDKNNAGINAASTGVVVGSTVVPLPNLEIFDAKLLNTRGAVRTEQAVNDTLVNGSALPPMNGVEQNIADMLTGRNGKPDPGIPNFDSNLSPISLFGDPKRFEPTGGMTSTRAEAENADGKDLPSGHRVDRGGEAGQIADTPNGAKSQLDELTGKNETSESKNDADTIKATLHEPNKDDDSFVSDDTRNQIATVLADQSENLTAVSDKRTVKDFIDELLHHTKRRTYRIDSGDTLEKLARRFLKDKRLAALIYLLNEDLLGNEADLGNIQLRPGTVLTMPSIEDVLQYRIHILHDVMPPHIYKSIIENPDERIVGSSKLLRATYSCRFGDRLTSVAARHSATRDEKLWTLIAQLNGLSLETDRGGKPVATLKRAQKLILPSRKDIEDHFRKANGGARPNAVEPIVSDSQQSATDVAEERATVNWGDGSDLPTPLSALKQKSDEGTGLSNRELGSDNVSKSGITSGPTSKGPKSKPRRIAPNEARIVAPEDLGEGTEEIYLRLEFEYEGKWMPVIEYTGTKEQIYLHVYTLAGRSDSIPIALPTRSIRELAECDLGANYQRYCQKFLAGDKPI